MNILKIITTGILISLLAVIFSASNTTPFFVSSLNQNDSDVTIGMTNDLKFTPDTVRIKKGDTVLWENSSLLVHSVTADHDKKTEDDSVELPEGAEPFDSGLLDPDETFRYTFTTKGTYKYFCMPHEAAMKGVIIVE